MRARRSYLYAVVRVVPRVEREEHVNVGAVVLVREFGVLVARIELDEARLLALAPDVDLPLVRRHLDAFVTTTAGGPAAGPVGALAPDERFGWLVAPRSTILQTSRPHGGFAADAEEALERVLDAMVRVVPRAARGAGRD